MLSASCTQGHDVRGRRRRAPARARPRSAAAGRPPARRRAASAGGSAAGASGTPTRRRAMAGRIARAAGARAWRPAEPGSRASAIGIEPTQKRRYSARTVPTSNPGGPAAGELPVDEQHARPAPRSRRGERQAVLPAQIAVDERAVRRRRRAASSSRAHTARLAWRRATRSWAPALRSSSELVRRLREATGPTSGRRRRRRRSPPAAGAAPPSSRPRTRAGMRGKRPLPWWSPSRARRRACAGRAGPPRARGARPPARARELRRAGERRRTAASWASAAAVRGVACLTT